MKYLAILTVCTAVAWLSQISSYVDEPLFFIYQSLWSFGVLFAVLSIECSKLTVCIVFIELLAISLNLFAVISIINLLNFSVYNYNVILISLNIAEAAILLLGAPWNGIIARISILWRGNNNYFSGRRRLVQVNPVLIREERS